MTYLQITWIDSTVWPVSSWNELGRSVCTNNYIEGWHHRVNHHAQKGNLVYFLLIELLYSVAARTADQQGEVVPPAKEAYKENPGSIIHTVG